MGHSSVRIKVRRRKVAHLAAYSKQFSVNNCIIKKVENAPKINPDTGNGPWEKKRYPQYKSMMKKHMEWIYNKEADVANRITEKVMVPSIFPTKKYDDYQKLLWKNLGIAAKMKAYEDEKVKKWEGKHPKPCPDDDLFRDEMIPAWEHEREQAVERIRDFVVSMFDKLPLTGRYKESDTKFVEKPVAELKDVNGDGHRVNELGPESKLLNKAQKVTNIEKANNAKLVATNLKDHKRTKGRIILPAAA